MYNGIENRPWHRKSPEQVSGPVVPHTAKAKRTMTRHVVTRASLRKIIGTT